MTTADDPQGSLLQQYPLLLSLLWTVPPFNANFQGAKEVSRLPLVEGKAGYDERIIADRRTFGWTLEESSHLARQETELSVPRALAIN